jgi:hypothetical protein
VARVIATLQVLKLRFFKVSLGLFLTVRKRDRNWVSPMVLFLLSIGVDDGDHPFRNTIMSEFLRLLECL